MDFRMKVRARRALVGFTWLLGSMTPALAQQLPVFPGAVGFGSDTPAGRDVVGDAAVRHVTNLADSGSGSLRDAVENQSYPFPRVVVFDVSGVISLETRIEVRNPFVTIAGQTAPPPGIIVKGEGIVVRAGDVLIQHIAVWTGNEVVPGSGSNLGSRGAFDVAEVLATGGASKIVFDHVSGGWTVDQVATAYGAEASKPALNVTFSNSLFAEGLRYPVPGHPAGDPDGHSAGVLFGGYTNGVSMIRSISAYNRWRNPLAKDHVNNLQVVNNFIYWPRHNEKTQFWSDTSNWTQTSSAQGNAYVLHPSNNNVESDYAITARATTTNTLNLFVDDNLIYNHDGSGAPAGTGDPWAAVRLRDDGGTITQLMDEPEFPDFHVERADRVESLVFTNSGARPAFRNPIDQRVLDDIENRALRGTDPEDPDARYSDGYLDDPDVVGGWPDWPQVTVPYQLPPNPTADDDGDGYKNLEEHLHDLAFRLEGNPRVAKADSFEDGNLAGWFVNPASGDWTVVTDGSSQVLQRTGTVPETQAYLTGTYFYEQSVRAKVKPTGFDSPTGFARVYARYRDPLHAYYVTLRGNNNVELRKVDGSVIALDSASLPISADQWYSVRISVKERELTGTGLAPAEVSAIVENLTTHDSVTLDYSDANPLPPGYAAVGTFSAAARFDDVFADPDADAESLDPAEPKSDDFEDGDDSGWTHAGTNDAWSVVLDGTNHVYRQDDTTFNALAYMNGTNWTDQVIEADVKPIAFNGANRFFGLFARFTNIDNTYYFILRSNNTMELKKIVDGASAPPLDSGSITVSPGTNYRLRLEAIGTSLKAFVNGTQVLSATDSTFASGRAALGTFMTQAQFDNVVVSPVAETLVFSDDFEDGNANGWTPGGTTAWSVVSDGSMVYRQTDTSADAWSLAGTALTDQIVSTRAKAIAFDGTDRWFGITARVVDATNYYYVTVRSSNVVELRKLVNGVITTLDTAPLTVALNTWYDLRLEAVGGTLKGYVNGQLLLEASDTSHASGKFGVRMFRASAAYDDFRVTEP